MIRIKKGDQVKILSGKDKGKTGKVIGLVSDGTRILVEGINLVKKRMRPKKQGQKGETVNVARSLHASNVMLVCPNCKKAARVGSKIDGQEKYRVCKSCEARV